VASQKWRTEDWIAVVLGVLVIVVTLGAFGAKVVDFGRATPTYRWTTDTQLAARAPAWLEALDAVVRDAEAKADQGAELADKAKLLQAALRQNDRKAIASTAGDLAKTGGTKTVAGALAAEIRGHAGATPGKVLAPENLQKVLPVGAAWILLGALGVALLGGKVRGFVLGFPAVFALAWIARVLAGNGLFVDYGIEYVILALVLGLVVSNTIGTPDWLKPAALTEYFIKTGLVILGASLLFSEVLQAGVLGLLQAILVVVVVWYVCFWIAKKLRVDDDFAAMLSSSVAICGVSAAIATCGAIQGDKKKLSYVTSLVLIVAVPMMIVMPWLVKTFRIPDVVAGAWMGGTLDTSATVVAAGALISDLAMKTGVIVKFSQNALIGVAAFILVLWWTYKGSAAPGAEKPSPAVIWERFPKFVLGFLFVSGVFSFLLPQPVVDGTKGVLAELRTWWFALAFVSIGLETKFVHLATMDGGRPAIAFIAAQAVNVIWTLLLAYLIFGGVIFPVPVIK
jgi:uncharacterized integral membrane protein (TIGR00698 family)